MHNCLPLHSLAPTYSHNRAHLENWRTACKASPVDRASDTLEWRVVLAVMPVCVHCARPLPALLTTFGSGYVALTRCASKEEGGCGRIADPYLEFGPTILFIDLVRRQLTQMLAKPRVYRHLLYNRNHSTPIPNPEPLSLRCWTHARHFLAYVLVESCTLCTHTDLRWFSLCRWSANAGVHPYVVAGENAPRLTGTAPRPWSRVMAHLPHLPQSLQSIVRVTIATAVESVLYHVAVVVMGFFIHRVWSHRERTPYTQLYTWDLPSVALLFSSVSTMLLLGFLLVWDSRLPLDRRKQQTFGIELSRWIPSANDAAHQPVLVALADVLGEWNTEWLIRTWIGGMSAGVALGTVLPMHPSAGMLVMLLGLFVQSVIRHRVVHLPGSHSATYLLQHGPLAARRAIAAYCEP